MPCMYKHRQSIIIIAALMLSACAVGPDYKRPHSFARMQFKEAKGKHVIVSSHSKEWKIAEPQDDFDRGEWWKMFNDATLNKLEARLNHCNQNIVNADQNYQQARALVDEARASFFPTLIGSISVTRQRQAGGSSSFVSSSSTGSTSTGTATTGLGSSGKVKPRITTVHSILFNASWEPDIWGLVRRQVEASASTAQASAALLAATRLSAQALLAQNYFELRGADTIQQLLNKTVADDRKALQLTRNQYASGVVSRADIVQAQSVLEAAQAQAINNGIARAQYEHAIAVLTGVTPADFSLPPYYRHTTPPTIPLVVPSTLLERRPDIAQAERTMQANSAQIGVALAAYFPTLTLSGSASVTGNGLAHWFSLPALNWAYGPQLAQTILDGGLRAATVAAARHGYVASVAAYRQVVLNAFQEVEDDLSSLRILNQQAIVDQQAVDSAHLALKLVLNQYRAGTVPYASVITAQTTALTAEQTAATVNYLRMTSAVGLVTALGGGWTHCQIACAGG